MSRRIHTCSIFVLLLGWTFVSATPAKELVIAFSLDTPPFVMKHGTAGIEVDIVQAALKPYGYTFTVRQMPYGELADAVKKQGVDAAATVIQQDDGTYYSNNYVTFQNFAVTKKSSGIRIQSIDDLPGNSILAWQNAYEDLGPEFKRLFSPKVKEAYREKYREIADQKEQVELFWQGENEVLVIDQAVFEWFSKELGGSIDDSQRLDYHNIFPTETKFRISFLDEQVRDDFNQGLKKLRESEAYPEIYDLYLK